MIKRIKRKITIFYTALLCILAAVCICPKKVAAEVKICGDFEYQYDTKTDGIEIVKYHGTAKKLTLPNTIEGLPVTVIGESAFWDEEAVFDIPYARNETLKEVILPDTVKNIKEDAFLGCVKLKKVTLPKKLEDLGEGVFASCEKLESINLPNTLHSIPDFTFSDCYSLKSIKIPKNVEYIGWEAFAGCDKLTKVTFAKRSKLKMINDCAFAQCFHLTKITFPASLKKIRGNIFEYDKRLKTVIFQGKVPKMDLVTFTDIPSNVVFKVPKKYKKQYRKVLRKQKGYQDTMIIK